MTLSAENKALVEHTLLAPLDGAEMISMFPHTLNRLLDAAREEGRQQGWSDGYDVAFRGNG